MEKSKMSIILKLALLGLETSVDRQRTGEDEDRERARGSVAKNVKIGI